MTEFDWNEAQEAVQAARDAECQAAGYCDWKWGAVFAERTSTHPDCPVHGDNHEQTG